MSEAADLVDRAVALPPGPELSAVLAELPWEKVPNARLVEIVRARSRQLSYEQAELFAGMVEISHAVAVEKLPGGCGERAEAVARAGHRFEWACHEIAAGLTWTPPAADRELGLATAVCERLPLVHAALQRGEIDRGKARVFVEYVDPASGELSEQQTRRLCERFVPVASGLTAKQLADRLYRALNAIDPNLRRQRYERAVQQRGVAVFLDPRTGTATLVGNGLPADEAAAAAGRNDRMVEAAKRAGHRGTRGQIGADIYLGMLTGEFHGLTEAEIIERVLAKHRPEDDPGPDSAGQDSAGHDSAGPGPDPGADPDDEPGAGDRDGDLEDLDDDDEMGDRLPDGDDEPADDTAERGRTEIPNETGTGSAAESGSETGSAAESSGGAGSGHAPEPSAPSVPSPVTAAGWWAGDRVATREGIEIRLGLGTAAGVDDRPGEIPGLGPVGAHIARTAVTAQQRGARWLFALVDNSGHLLLAGPLRRRPRSAANPPPVGGGVVELHLTADELQRYAADPSTDPSMAVWHPILAEIAAAWNNREQLLGRLGAHPHTRFARGPLADHVRTRDRYCIGPGCTRAARRCDLDHTRDHSHGGRTVESNIGPACWRHHPDKDRGWTLSQPEPGLFRWVSPLGRTYWSRGEPIRHDLPDPDPTPDQHEEAAAEVDARLRRHDPQMLERPAEESARPPPPKPELPPDDPPPPF